MKCNPIDSAPTETGTTGGATTTKRRQTFNSKPFRVRHSLLECRVNEAARWVLLTSLFAFAMIERRPRRKSWRTLAKFRLLPLPGNQLFSLRMRDQN